MTSVTRHTRIVPAMIPALIVAIVGLLLWLLTTPPLSVIGFVLLLIGGVFVIVDLILTASRRP